MRISNALDNWWKSSAALGLSGFLSGWQDSAFFLYAVLICEIICRLCNLRIGSASISPWFRDTHVFYRRRRYRTYQIVQIEVHYVIHRVDNTDANTTDVSPPFLADTFRLCLRQSSARSIDTCAPKNPKKLYKIPITFRRIFLRFIVSSMVQNLFFFSFLFKRQSPRSRP